MLKAFRANLPFLVALAAGISFISLGITGVGFTHYPGDLIDGRFNNYLLEHAYNFFTGREASFWSAPFMFPEKNVITYSDNLLGTAPFYAFFRLTGADRETGYQCWFLLMAILNFTGCYVLLKHVFKNPYASAAGAMVFAFSLALHSQMGHAQTFPRFAIPLCFFTALLFLEELKPVYFFLSAFLVVYQIYCGIYIGFLLGACIGIFFIISLLLNYRAYIQKFKELKWWAGILLSLVVNILLLLPLVLPYLERAAQLGYYSYEQVSQSLLTPKCFLFSWWGTFFWQYLNGLCIRDFPNYADYQVFPGALATVGLMLFVVVMPILFVRKKSDEVTSGKKLMMLFISGLVIFLVFVRLGEFSLYKLIYNIPGFGSLRALQRIINIELVFYAVGTAFCLDQLMKNRKMTIAVFGVFVLLFIPDNYVKSDNRHRHEVAESRARVEPLVKKIQKIGSRKILSYEPDTVDSSIMDFQVDAMLAAQSLGLRTLNGYSSTSPPGYGNYWSAPNETHRLEWLKARNIEEDSVMVIH